MQIQRSSMDDWLVRSNALGHFMRSAGDVRMEGGNCRVVQECVEVCEICDEISSIPQNMFA